MVGNISHFFLNEGFNNWNLTPGYSKRYIAALQFNYKGNNTITELRFLILLKIKCFFGVLFINRLIYLDFTGS